MRDWWRSLRVDEKIAAIAWLLFLLFILAGTWIPHDELGGSPW